MTAGAKQGDRQGPCESFLTYPGARARATLTRALDVSLFRGCLALTAGFLGPRIALFVWWLFGDKPDAAIDSWVWGLLGFLFLPWTTLMYIIAWSPVVGVDGFWDYLIVGIGVALDIATYAAKPAQRARGY